MRISKDDVIAILVADIHLSHAVPAARSVEKSWYDSMARPLRELCLLQKNFDVPILYAGDVFHSWNSCPELVNFAIKELPKMWAVPGQHDLPHHSLEEINRSAYWTLVESGKIAELSYYEPTVVWGEYTGCGGAEPDEGWKDPMVLHAFPWGEEIVSNKDDQKGMHIALVHRYLWSDKHGGYPGAPKENKAENMRDVLKGYDVAVFGDNHRQFQTKVGDCTVYNCGCLIPRMQDERALKPSVGLLKVDGSVETHRLDTAEDEWLDRVEEESTLAVDGELKEFLSGLSDLSPDNLDFREAIERLLDEIGSDGVKKILLEVLG